MSQDNEPARRRTRADVFVFIGIVAGLVFLLGAGIGLDLISRDLVVLLGCGISISAALWLGLRTR